MDEELKAKYRHVLEGLSQLPSLPVIVSKILAVLNNPRSRADDVVRYLEMDVGLSGKILRLANSAYYGMPGKIHSIQRAVVQLGFNAISALVLSASVFQLFKDPPEKRLLFNRESFWRHSVETALSCKAIAGLCRTQTDPEIAFTQGILHDVGIIAMESSFAGEYQDIITRSRQENIPLEHLERERFGLDHGKISSWILERWRLPEIIFEPVSHHHDPHQSRFKPYAIILSMASGIADSRGSRLYPQLPFHMSDLRENLAQLGISSYDEETVMRLCAEELQRADTFTGLLGS